MRAMLHSGACLEKNIWYKCQPLDEIIKGSGIVLDPFDTLISIKLNASLKESRNNAWVNLLGIYIYNLIYIYTYRYIYI